MSSQELATDVRIDSIRMISNSGSSHLGGSLSEADILAVLYADILRYEPSDPKWPHRDRFILSKGHCCSALYATLAHCGFFPKESLENYAMDGSCFMSHASHMVPGVEFSTGSLGHGLPHGCGKALAAKLTKQDWRVFVLLSDGELDEGSNWEAILFAQQSSLSNLVVIVDYNKIQSLGRVSEVMDLEPLIDKFKAFRWGVTEVDGHNHHQIKEALSSVPWVSDRPSCLIAHTIKGKGVDFMEDKLAWHYKTPSKDESDQACLQLRRNP
jgi:transketolase